MLEDLTKVYSGLWFNENDVMQYSLRRYYTMLILI